MTNDERLKLAAEFDLKAAEDERVAIELGAELMVEVQSERDQQGLLWLVATVGKTVVANAVATLPGDRRAYLSNICRSLNMEISRNAGPKIRAQLLRAQVRAAITAEEREEKAEADAATRRTARIAGLAP